MPSTSNIEVPYVTSLPKFPRLKRTILVVEDSADSREMLEVLLEMKGYDVISAGDGHRAFDVAVQQVPDLILIDLELPGLDGLSVTQKLRQHPQFDSVPIIMMSGHDASVYRAAALSAGCDDYLPKPIHFELFDEILRERIPTHSNAPALPQPKAPTEKVIGTGPLVWN